MIKQDYVVNDGIPSVYTYSTENKFIIQNETGIKFEDAMDVLPLMFTYTETEETIPPVEIVEENDLASMETEETITEENNGQNN